MGFVKFSFLRQPKRYEDQTKRRKMPCFSRKLKMWIHKENGVGSQRIKKCAGWSNPNLLWSKQARWLALLSIAWLAWVAGQVGIREFIPFNLCHMVEI